MGRVPKGWNGHLGMLAQWEITFTLFEPSSMSTEQLFLVDYSPYFHVPQNKVEDEYTSRYSTRNYVGT